MKADLHVHTTKSDGLLSLKEVLIKKQEENIDLIAITDHDAIFEEKIDGVINGIELSTRLNNEDIHVLGYFYDLNNLDELKEYLKKQKENRIKRIKDICNLLKIHYDLDIDSFEILNNAIGIIGRPHIAKAISKKYGISFNDAFNKYLTSDSKAYIKATSLNTIEGIEMLKRCHAITIIAHPVLYKKNSFIDLIKLADGAECIYPNNTLEDEKNFLKIAKELEKIVTAGSDFHGDTKHSNLGHCTLQNEDLKIFLNRLNNN